MVKESKLEENVELDDLIKKIDDRIAELEKSDKLNNVSPYQEDSEQKLSETKKEENVNEFLKFANSINDDIMNEQKIEKPKINVDADSIIVDENITDDEFFDDFFENGEYRNFIINSYNYTGVQKTGSYYYLNRDIKINLRSLRSHLENKGIIRKFGF